MPVPQRVQLPHLHLRCCTSTAIPLGIRWCCHCHQAGCIGRVKADAADSSCQLSTCECHPLCKMHPGVHAGHTGRCKHVMQDILGKLASGICCVWPFGEHAEGAEGRVGSRCCWYTTAITANYKSIPTCHCLLVVAPALANLPCASAIQ